MGMMARRPIGMAVLLGLLLLALAIVSPAARANGPDACRAEGQYERFTLHAEGLGRRMEVFVFLPAGYGCDAAQRYPVFYFSDGQDLFDWYPYGDGLTADVRAEIEAMEARYGSWRLGAQIDAAADRGALPPTIVVGIASTGGARSRDLAPVAWQAASEGRGAAYGAFIADVLVPAIDARYRTVPARACRGIGGSSLGGVSALQIGLAHAGDFAMVLALSPIIGVPSFADYLLPAWVRTDQDLPSRFFVDFDDDRVGDRDLRWLGALVAHAPHPQRTTLLTQTPGGVHEVASWRQRVMPGLAALFDGQCQAGATATLERASMP
jgi:enterochelin esterase-like enzyme